MANDKLHHTLTARILHWINFGIIVMLIITGLQIREPVNFAIFSTMGMAIKLHYITMYMLISVTVIKFYYSCFNKDYREIFLKPKDIKNLPKVFKYYLFLSETLPKARRYNPGQKALYNTWILMVIFQAVTGFILYSPAYMIKYAPMLGGPILIRQMHFLMTWGFVVTAAIHMYFAFLSGWSSVKSIFTGKLDTGDSGEIHISHNI